MIIQFFFSILLSVVLLLSFYGWGQGIVNFLSRFKATNDISDCQINWIQYTVIGVSFFVFVTGIMSLYSIYNIFVILGIIVIGLLFLPKIFQPRIWAKSWCSILKRDKFVLSSLVIILLVQLFILVSKISLNTHDDYHGYLNFPLMLIDTGGINFFSFNERAALSLGGNAFLQSIYLGFFDKNYSIFPEGLAYCLLTLLPIFSFKGQKFWPYLLSLCIILSPYKALNISAVYTGTLFCASILLFWIQNHNILFRNKIWGALIIIAIQCAAVFSFKSTFIVFGCLFVSTFVLLHIFTPSKILSIFRGMAGISISIAVFLLPWLLASYNNFNTLLFPFLGRGNHITGHSEYPRQAWSLNWQGARETINAHLGLGSIWLTFIFTLTAVIIFFWILLNIKNKKNKDVSIFYLAIFCAAIGYKATLYWGASYIAARYSYPVDLIATIFLVQILILVFKDKCKFRVFNFSLLIIVFFILLTDTSPINFQNTFSSIIMRFSDLKTLMSSYKSNTITNNHDLEINKFYIDAQSKIPEGEKVFTFSDRPFYFDFKKNSIFISDSGCVMSPPPYMPQAVNEKKFIEYFRTLGFKYLVYSKNEANYSQEMHRKRLTSINLLVRGYTKSVFSLQDNLMNLINGGYLFYENDHLWVIRI